MAESNPGQEKPPRFLNRPYLGNDYKKRREIQNNLLRGSEEFEEDLRKNGRMLRGSDEYPLNFESWEKLPVTGEEHKVNHPVYLSEIIPNDSVMEIREFYYLVVEVSNKLREKYLGTTFVKRIDKKECDERKKQGALVYSLQEGTLPLAENPKNKYFLNSPAK